MGPPLAPSPISLLEDFFRKECDVELLGICKGEPSAYSRQENRYDHCH
jgi:hypothetical protein